MNVPSNLKYTKDHEWLSIDGNIAKIGITDFAQSELGEIVYVELEEKESSCSAEEVIGSIEAIKTVSDIFSPVTGVIVKKNEKLEDQPELVNEDPYGEGWLVQIEMSVADEVAALLSAENYMNLTT